MSEAEIYRELSSYRLTTQVACGPTDILLSLEPEDVHHKTSPDFLLWLTVEFSLFGHGMKVRVPIPIEAEKAGLGVALADLEKLVERGQFRVECPFLVIAESGYDSRRLERSFTTDFSVKQIPQRDLNCGTE